MQTRRLSGAGYNSATIPINHENHPHNSGLYDVNLCYIMRCLWVILGFCNYGWYHGATTVEANWVSISIPGSQGPNGIPRRQGAPVFLGEVVDLPNSLPTVCGSEVVDGMVSIHLPHYSIRLSDLSHGNLFQFPWVGVKLNQQTSLGHASRPALQVPNRQPCSETASKTPGESPGQMIRWVPGWVYSNVHITQFWECYHPVNIPKNIHN